MPDAEQRNLCQQTEMGLWLKAKSLVRFVVGLCGAPAPVRD